MKFLFAVLITILLCQGLFAQCPTNDQTSVEILEDSKGIEVKVVLNDGYNDVKEINLIKFGAGIVEEVRIQKRNRNEFIIKEIEPGEYMIQIIGNDCKSLVGTDKDYHGFIIK